MICSLWPPLPIFGDHNAVFSVSKHPFQGFPETLVAYTTHASGDPRYVVWWQVLWRHRGEVNWGADVYVQVSDMSGLATGVKAWWCRSCTQPFHGHVVCFGNDRSFDDFTETFCCSLPYFSFIISAQSYVPYVSISTIIFIPSLHHALLTFFDWLFLYRTVHLF